MTAFASQRRVVALERDETGDTEPGARANESDRSAWARFAAADLRHVGCVESRDRERESSEVVQHQQPGEPEVRLQRADGKAPVVVRHGDAIADDRVGHSKRGPAWPRCANLREVGLNRFSHVPVSGGSQRARFGQLLTRRELHGEAGVGPADVAEQPRKALTRARGHSGAYLERKGSGAGMSPSVLNGEGA